jgi:hypothetical protein
MIAAMSASLRTSYFSVNRLISRYAAEDRYCQLCNLSLEEKFALFDRRKPSQHLNMGASVTAPLGNIASSAAVQYRNVCEGPKAVTLNPRLGERR